MFIILDLCTNFTSQTFMQQIDAIAKKCNYAGYIDKYVRFPPKGLLPLPGKSTDADPGCDVWGLRFDAALIVNPAFNIYRIFDTYPVLWDVLGFPWVFFIQLKTEAIDHLQGIFRASTGLSDIL
jgi:hypothetical protein